MGSSLKSKIATALVCVLLGFGALEGYLLYFRDYYTHRYEDVLTTRAYGLLVCGLVLAVTVISHIARRSKRRR